MTNTKRTRQRFTREEFGAVNFRLIEYLEEHSISLNWLHEATGIRYATLYDMGSNVQNSINLIHLNMIMDALNISDMNLLLEKLD
ncbi:helix-turn-helix domain-containing protein [Oceanobacillus sp. FSL H7-0719]|uniref:helix-turn-helix domain-containing protein n=1 Tax=Oceanobacillus sp. FSL H7-0719 TaxID=2954507 RepID=UPI0032469CE2